jgi:hypothetical protein
VPADDFDFLQGPWTIENVLYRNGVESRFRGEHSGITKHMGGIVNTDVTSFTPPAPATPFRGMSLRLLDPSSDEWSIYWINDTSVSLSSAVHGAFRGNEGTFLSRDEDEEDPTLWRFLWQRIDTDEPHWEQGYSKDAGATWTVDWTMDFRRVQD